MRAGGAAKRKKKKKNKGKQTNLEDADNEDETPDVSFCFVPGGIAEANKRASSVTVPVGYGFKPSNIFSSQKMKSHDWLQFLKSNIFKYSILGLLPECQETTLFRFLDALGMLLREEQSVSNLDSLELELCEAMALMERDFPCVIQDISFHLLHHIVEGIQVTGPVQGMWMFPFERFNSWIARRVTSRRYPEATVMETYRIFDWCYFMKISGRLPDELAYRPECCGNGTKRTKTSPGSSGQNYAGTSAVQQPSATKTRSSGAMKVKTGNPTKDELVKLSRQIGRKWKSLAGRLGFERAEITDFDESFRRLAEKAKEMLLDWQDKKGSEATYQVLYDALCHEFVACKALAEEFCCSKEMTVHTT